MDFRGGVLRAWRAVGAVGLIGALSATTLVLVYAGVLPTGPNLPTGSKSTPYTLTVFSSSSLPPEVQAQEAATAPLLFDRDTNTQHAAFAESQVQATFEAAQEVRSIKIFGPAPYTLTVKADAGGSFQAIGGLENLNLALLSSAWHTFQASSSVTTTKLLFVLTPATGGSASGLRELEVWTTSPPVSARNGAALLERLLGATPPAQARLYAALNPTANPTVGVVTPKDSGGSLADNTFSFTLDRDPAVFVRAYLTYELLGQASFVSPRRRINGFTSSSGGSLLLPAETWSNQVERINPAWLKPGANTIEFTVLSSSFQEAGYTVRNVRVVGELDNGANAVESIIANQPDAGGTNPVAALYDGDSTTGWRPYPADQPINAVAPAVEYELRRPTQLDAVSLYLSTPFMGQVQLSAKKDGEWIDFPPEAAGALDTAWNTIQLPPSIPLEQRVYEAIRLTFLGGEGSSAEVRELLFTGSPVGGRTTPPRIVVVYPDDGQFYGRRGFVQGFVEPWNNGSGQGTLRIGGLSYIQVSGEISGWVGKNDVGLANQADNDPWSAEVTMTYPNGEVARSVVSFTQQVTQATPTTGPLAGSTSSSIGPKTKKTISHDESKLVVEAGTVASDTTITITPLAEETVPALDVGMVNVTKGPRRGYRFLPHGARFQKNINVTLPYDRALIPPGHTEDDVRTYYFDDQAGRWIALPFVGVDKTNKLLNSTTDHFTDMINAVVTVPDHPQAVSFNPTSMKDIKAADPGAQVNLIEAPRGNNQGDARVSYPIEVPPGRQGLQPQLAVQYSSSGGNGWMGMGWDIPMQAITIDTRWGVPRYDAGLESETYMLSGEQLTPVAHRTELVARTTDKVFHTRVEGQFRRIIRRGSHPNNYTWEVTDKNGVKYLYGATDPATETLADAAGNRFLWALCEIRDPNGNFVKFRYARVNDNGVPGGSVPGTNIYLQKVTYTGSGSTEGLYSVTFVRDRDLNELRRPDVQIDARGGFKRVTADLLRKVEVTFANALIRRYEFDYNQNPYGDQRTGVAFNKTLLTTISQFASDGTTLFNKHTLTYYDEARNASGQYQPFLAAQGWTPQTDNVDANFRIANGAYPDTASALSGQKGDSSNRHFMVSFGIYDGKLTCKSLTVGGKVGFSSTTSEGMLALVDIDGDNLPDKVIANGSGLSWRKNQSGPGGGTVFDGNLRQVGGPLGRFSVDRSKNRNAGIEAVLGCEAITATAGVNTSTTTTSAEVYFSDVNGDGLMDLAVNGTVFFNRLDASKNPTFATDSAGTPNPVGAGAVDPGPFPGLTPAEQQALINQHPLHDTVRVWEAPFAGTVAISGTVRLVQDTSAARTTYGDKADGVRVAIQLEGTELWNLRILGTNYDPQTPTGVNAVPVNKGDQLYFRVQSVADGAYDQVDWAPAIEYVNFAPQPDANNKALFSYSASSDFLLSAYPEQTVGLPLAGQVTVEGTFTKPATSDDVTVTVFHNQAVVFQQQLAGAQPASLPISQSLAVAAGDTVRLRVSSDSNVDWSALGFAPRVFYTQAADPSIPVLDPQGNPQIQIKAAVEYALFGDWLHAAPPSPWLATANGTFYVSPALDLAPDASGSVAFTIKRNGELLAKQILTVTNGAISAPQPVPALPVTVAQGEALWIEFHSPNLPKGKVLNATTSIGVAPGDPQPATVTAGYYVPRTDIRFGPMYRQWGQFAYNGNGAFGLAAIDESVLVLPSGPTADTGTYNGITDEATLENKLSQEGYDPTSARFVMMVPDFDTRRWLGFDDLSWVQAERASSSRLGDDDLTAINPVPSGTARAIVRTIQSSDKSFSFAGGVSGGGFGASGGPSVTRGNSRTLADFMDMNGDRYPDIVSAGAIQYTTMLGGLEPGARPSGLETPRVQDTKNDAVTAGGAYGKASQGQRPARTIHEASMSEPSIGLNGSFGRSGDEEQHGWADVNGDGLPDRIYRGGDVSLNLGYTFAPREPWAFGQVSVGKGESSSAGLGFNIGAYSIGGGISLARSDNEGRETLMDVTGDGLPDKIIAGNPIQVAINTGTGFLPAIAWPGAPGITAGSSSTESVSAYFTVCIPLVPPLLVAKICFNAGGGESDSMSRQLQQLSDVDGDGFVDVLTSTTDNTLTVARSTIGRTNLLKRVLRPMGATIDLEYTRDGNTYELPQSRWNMTRVQVYDGHAGEGADLQLTTYRYLDPKHDRRERDFYGYASVVEEHRDTQNLGSLYRSIAREFLTDSYYTKGLLKREVLQDQLGNPFTETENTYVVRDEASGQPLADLQSTTATGFPMLTQTDKRFYEGQLAAGKTTFTTHTYDAFGNVETFSDAGEILAPADDVLATIQYTNCQPAYIIKPRRIEVRGNGTPMRLREADIDCTTGDLRQVRQYLADLSAAVTDLSYFPNGNLQTVTGPANRNGQRYTLTYEYDAQVQTHVSRITDSFGLSSQASYNLHFGKVETTVDTNANQTTNVYDLVGRLESIYGPYEQGQSVATLSFDYAPIQTPSYDTGGNLVLLTSVPNAITRHVDKDAEGAYKATGTIDTILFTDGLKRVIQTKKDAAVLDTGAAPQDRMIVSGLVTFDAFGRTTAQRYPNIEPKASEGVNRAFNPAPDGVAPTTMAYDVLDRNTRTTIPDGTFTTLAYGFGADRGSNLQFETTVRDANVNAGQPGAVKHTYRDVRELITAVKEILNASPVWTSYAYDPLKQIVQVTDDQNNVTTVAYDNFGRRTEINNPDAGRTETQYDLASNVTKKVTANLRAQSKSIDYDYQFNRLVSITYPTFAGNNVSYTYGAPGAAFNSAGRITRITSQMGVEERQYGKLGETVYEKKVVTTFTDPLHPSLFETRYHFETFGRLLRITYPDLEVVTNTYDSGGNLARAEGVKAVAASGQNHRYRYLHNLFYDKFEQRAFMEQGNGVKTAYTYDAQTRRLANLNAVRQGNNIFQNLQYSYDNVGNVRELQNQVAVPPPNVYGGPTVQHFDYDSLYRLTGAWGTFQYSPDKSHRYDLAMSYDTIHNITRKTQNHVVIQPSGTPITQKRTTYDFTYLYNPSGPASVRPHAPIHLGERAYTYDANGNQLGWTHDQNGTRRNIVWDDENRIQSLFDNGHEKTYKYDDQGSRIIKRGPQGETVYVNQFYTQRPGATGSKHIYAGTSRIATKLLRQDAPNSNPNGNTPFEKDLYFYHPDHLGSSSYITDLNGKLYEHLEYFPFGEAWVEENSNAQRTPYHFTAKELDEETGLYYFGARYYDPRVSVWQTVDPALPSYFDSPRGLGGIRNSKNLALYHYAGLNPLVLSDPDGRSSEGGFWSNTKERFGNLFSQGRFMTNDQNNLYSAGMHMAYLAGGPKAMAQYVRENPAFGGTQAVAEFLTGVGAVRSVGAARASVSVAVSADNAVQFLLKQGIDPDVAKSFVRSFDGPITARLVEKGESFLRYTDVPGSSGSFLTKTAFQNADEAARGLNTVPYGNMASTVQTVTAKQSTIVLEGGIAGGQKGVQQTLTLDRGAFEFSQGVSY